MSNLIETFNIPIYEWKTVDAGQKTIRIKGVALRGDVVSKNNRKYTREALMKATNTWINKPVNVNHDNTKKVGVIKWMDYDAASDALLYEAEINREPYITLLRNKSAEIRGLSIQADYLHTVCARCGKKFYTEEEWYYHVTQEEFMKDLPTEPHGIMGSAISLVLSPEVPGYQGTTYELAEMARRATLRLLETVIKTRQEEEKYKMSKIALRTKTGNIAVGKSGLKGLAEQEEEPAVHQCPEGEHWSEEQGKCVANIAAEQEHECPEGEHWDETEQKCVTNVTEQEEHKCPEGEHWSEQEGKCVKNAAETPPETTELLKDKLKPFKVSETAPKLKLGEPFAGYDNFEDCVAKNQEKENPEAYCGTIKKQAEGEMLVQTKTAEKLNEVVNALNNMRIPKDDASWKMKVAKIESQVKTLTESIKALPLNKLQVADSKLSKRIDTIKSYDDKPLMEKIDAIKPYDDTEVKQKLDEVTTKIPKLEETIAQQKKDFDNLLGSADESVKEYFEANKKEMQEKDVKIKELEQKLSDAEKQKLQETEKLETRVENLEDKLQPQFKSIAQKAQAEKKQSPDLSYKPGGK